MFEEKCDSIAAAFLVKRMRQEFDMRRIAGDMLYAESMGQLTDSDILKIAETSLMDAMLLAKPDIMEQEMTITKFIVMTMKYLGMVLDRKELNEYDFLRAEKLAKPIETHFDNINHSSLFILN